MGLRFRKSIKIAPGVKLNLNKKSSSITVGGKGAHYTVSSTGKKTTSVGIPGTGLSYSTSSGGKKKSDSGGTVPPVHTHNSLFSSNGGKKKKPRKFTVILAIFVLMLIGSLMSCEGDNLEKVSISSDTLNECDINADVNIIAKTNPDDYVLSIDDFKSSGGNLELDGNKAIFSSSEAGNYEVWVEHNDIKSNIIEITVVDKEAEKAKRREEAEAKKKAEEERIAAEQQAEQERIAAEQAALQAEQERIAAEQAAAQQPQEQMVWISATGSKYHSKNNCGRMNPNTARQIPLSQAESSYEPCSKCF